MLFGVNGMYKETQNGCPVQPSAKIFTILIRIVNWYKCTKH